MIKSAKKERTTPVMKLNFQEKRWLVMLSGFCRKRGDIRAGSINLDDIIFTTLDRMRIIGKRFR
jgi:hypothetical protein